MPTVSPYKDDPGYYVTANPGAGHPIRIKTRKVMDKIFRELGITEKTEISHDLCWALYDADLIYTKNSIPDEQEDGQENPDYDLSAVNLSEEQRQALLEAVEKNADSEKVAELRNMITDHSEFTEATFGTNSESNHDSSTSIDESLIQTAKFGNDDDTVHLDGSVSQILDLWNVEAVLNSDGEEVERSELSPNEARGLNNLIPKSRFPDTTPSYVRSTEDFVEYGIPYETESTVNRLEDIVVYDYRSTEDGASATLNRRYKAHLQVFYQRKATVTMVFSEDHGCIEKSVSPSIHELTSGIDWPDAMHILDNVEETQEKIREIEDEFRKE